MSDDRFAPWIPFHVNGTLPEAQRRELEAHLTSCDECRELLETARDLHAPGRPGAPDLLDHPHAAYLERFALNPASLDAGLRVFVGDHLAACPACRDASRIAGRALAAETIGAARGARYGLARAAALFLAGSLATAAGFWWFVPRGQRTGVASNLQGGRIDLPIVASSLRGEEKTVIELRPGQKVVLIGLSVDSTSGLTAASRVMLDLERQGRKVWADTLSGEELQASVRHSGILTLAFPADQIPAGDYVITLSVVPPAMVDPLMRSNFRVIAAPAQRQSPTATNPPQ